MKFAIIGKEFSSQQVARIRSLMDQLTSRGAVLTIERGFMDMLTEAGIQIKEAEIFQDDDFTADILISLGGDGTFLKAATFVGRKNIPILGINTGRLGFLADISLEEMESTVDEVLLGHYKIEERSVLELNSNHPELFPNPYALNEVSILKHDNSSMIAVHTSVGGRFLNTYQADGLIIATPTGSTAYSLSVGGPIIEPNARAIALTPIAPHSLTCRPIVIRDDWAVSMSVESRSHKFLVSIDGRSQSCTEDTVISVTKAPYTIKVLTRYDHDYFSTLHGKLMWGVDAR